MTPFGFMGSSVLDYFLAGNSNFLVAWQHHDVMKLLHPKKLVVFRLQNFLC